MRSDAVDVVVDYAETRRETVCAAAAPGAARAGAADPDRAAGTRRGRMVAQLGRETGMHAELMAGFADGHLLEPLPDDVPARARAVYDAAVAAFAARLHLPPPTIPAARPRRAALCDDPVRSISRR